MNILRQHALGLLEHRYQGECPSADDPNTRDVECVVCYALDATITTEDIDDAADEAREEVLAGPPNGMYDGYFIRGFRAGAVWGLDVPGGLV